MTEEIQIFNKNLRKLSAFKANYKLMEAEEKALTNQNNAQQKDLQRKLSKEQTSEDKNNVTQAENGALSRETSALQLKAQELRNTLRRKRLFINIH